jgi:hypothetical protein
MDIIFKSLSGLILVLFISACFPGSGPSNPEIWSSNSGHFSSYFPSEPEKFERLTADSAIVLESMVIKDSDLLYSFGHLVVYRISDIQDLKAEIQAYFGIENASIPTSVLRPDLPDYERVDRISFNDQPYILAFRRNGSYLVVTFVRDTVEDNLILNNFSFVPVDFELVIDARRNDDQNWWIINGNRAIKDTLYYGSADTVRVDHSALQPLLLQISSANGLEKHIELIPDKGLQAPYDYISLPIGVDLRKDGNASSFLKATCIFDESILDYKWLLSN